MSVGADSSFFGAVSSFVGADSSSVGADSADWEGRRTAVCSLQLAFGRVQAGLHPTPQFGFPL